MSGASAVAGAAAWHDVECSSYDADLGLWRELAAGRGGPILDLGAGTGRVALDLAARGHEVTAVDIDPELVAACDERARARSLPVTGVVGDARSLELDAPHPLAILPMQVAQLMGSDEGRRQMLRALLDVLSPGGLVAIALADPFEGIPPRTCSRPCPTSWRSTGGSSPRPRSPVRRAGRRGGHRPDPDLGLPYRRADRGARHDHARRRGPAGPRTSGRRSRVHGAAGPRGARDARLRGLHRGDAGGPG
ncbi:MAG: class I SAM-dependent methyltransferase [Thermoleophilaceae bacterium]